MNKQTFLKTIISASKQFGIHPLLLLSGIEGIYTFKDIPINNFSYGFLDSLILTIYTLRIGNKFHSNAEKNLSSTDNLLRRAADYDLSVLSAEEIERSRNRYLQSFASVIQGKSPIRNYHIKALELAANEIERAQSLYHNNIGTIVMTIFNQESKRHTSSQYSS